MKLSAKLAVLALAAALPLSFAGCEKTRDELQPDMDRVMAGDHGPQCANLREMASRLAPQMLAECREINESPYRAVVVMKHLDNKTMGGMRGRDLDIFLTRLANDLSTAAASTRVQFKAQRAELTQMQREELGNANPFEDAGRAPAAPTNELTAQYILNGQVEDLPSGRTNYYLFTFYLTNLQTGARSWTGQYEVRTLN